MPVPSIFRSTLLHTDVQTVEARLVRIDLQIAARAFEKREQEMMEEYRKAGMYEEIIQEMHEFDLEVFKGDRAYYEHTCPLVQGESKVAEDNTIVGLTQGKEEPTCFVEDMTTSNDWIDEILKKLIEHMNAGQSTSSEEVAVCAQKN